MTPRYEARRRVTPRRGSATSRTTGVVVATLARGSETSASCQPTPSTQHRRGRTERRALAPSGARPRRPNRGRWPRSSALGHLTPSLQTSAWPDSTPRSGPFRPRPPSSSSLPSSIPPRLPNPPRPPRNSNLQNRPPVPGSCLPKLPRGNGPSPSPFYLRRCAYIVPNHVESWLYGVLLYLCLHLQNVWLRIIECIVV